MESVSNSRRLINVNKAIGTCIKILCYDSCLDTDKANVYGDQIYS